MIKSIHLSFQKKLLFWFEKNKRTLPWRNTRNPYAIWISEVMLQQTTSKAVIPYYKKFLQKFPDISSLARAKKSELFLLWAGLGYYKRVEKLILSAKQLQKKGVFPKTYTELLQFPGFGPYIARAVSSLAFEEPVGVLDGNVIRFLSRFHALPLKHWTAEGRAQLQCLSDLWVKNQKPSVMNQALMEMGSLVCRSKNPLCLLCPLTQGCLAYKKNMQASLPLTKTKSLPEFWHWKPEKIKKGNRLAFVENTNLPFLKGHLLFPGGAKRLKNKVQSYDFIHHIMNYQIFVTVQNKSIGQNKVHSLKWLTQLQIEKLNPSSLIKKVFDHN